MFMPSQKEIPIVGGEWITFGPNLSGYLMKNGYDHIVIYSHGNGGNLTWYSTVANKLAQKSDVLLYDYPGYGRSKGIPGEKDSFDSGLHVYDYVKSLGYNKIWAYGFSLGGAMTTHMAANRKLDGIVLQSTFANISDCVPFVGNLVASNNFTSIKNMEKIECPVMIAHCPRDDVVPYSSGRRLYDSIKGEKLFYELDGNHNDHPYETKYYDYIFDHVFT